MMHWEEKSVWTKVLPVRRVYIPLHADPRQCWQMPPIMQDRAAPAETARLLCFERKVVQRRWSCLHAHVRAAGPPAPKARRFEACGFENEVFFYHSLLITSLCFAPALDSPKRPKDKIVCTLAVVTHLFRICDAVTGPCREIWPLNVGKNDCLARMAVAPQ